MSYDQCCKRWGDACEYEQYVGKGGHFCSEMVAEKGGSHLGACKCNCGATNQKIAIASSNPRRTLALAAMAMAAAVPMGGAVERSPIPASSRAREEDRRGHIASRPDSAERIAKAEAKRERKKARRALPPSPEPEQDSK